jgi:hypothetical protein
MRTKKRWKLIRWVWGQHKWFEDLHTGRIGVCDDSGDHPEEADDGILWLAQDRAIRLTVSDETPCDEYGTPEQFGEPVACIPVAEPEDGTLKYGHVLSSPDEYLWVAGEFGMAIELHYDSGRPGYRLDVKVSRIQALSPKNAWVSVDDDDEEA